MNIVKYIISCIVGCFDALVGNGMNGGIKEGIVGLVSIASIIILFFVSFIILEKRTNIGYKKNILISILTTIILVLMIFLMLIIYESIFCWDKKRLIVPYTYQKDRYGSSKTFSEICKSSSKAYFFIFWRVF